MKEDEFSDGIEEEDDQDEWESLEVLPQQPQRPQTTTTENDKASTMTTIRTSPKPDSAVTIRRASSLNNETTSASHTHIRKQLLHEPLQILWTRFWLYLLQTTWRKYMLPLSLILLGSIFQIFLWWHFSASPRWIVTGGLLLGGYLFLNDARFHIPQYGRLLTFLWLLLPSVLELRALQLVLQLMVQSEQSISILATSAVILFVVIRGQRQPPRKVTHTVWIILYVASLYVALSCSLQSHSMALLAPLVTGTGMLLLSRQQHTNDDVIQRALRRSLHDVVQQVGTSLHQDELLQVAMVRWIADYWTATATTTTPTPSTASGRRENEMPSSRTTPSPQSSGSAEELGWDELYPMLNATLDQYETEADVLFGENRANDDASRTHVNQGDNMNSLREMLASMDMDKEAKPCVESYRITVEAFPPSTRTALLVAVAKRCPATLLLLGYVLFEGFPVWNLLVALLLLGPIVSLEYKRVHLWACSCQPDCQDHPTLQGMEELNNPMLLLLSDDVHDPANPRPMLRVWLNVVNSVTALQRSLTTARCVQTTAVAVDFAQNILSLAQLGYEISHRGWGHGAQVILREWILLSNRERPETAYTEAATNVMRNSQTMGRNIRALLEEDGGHQLVAPILALIPTLIGYGWLWLPEDQGAENSRNTRSSVVIEELDEVTPERNVTSFGRTPQVTGDSSEQDGSPHIEHESGTHTYRSNGTRHAQSTERSTCADMTGSLSLEGGGNTELDLAVESKPAVIVSETQEEEAVPQNTKPEFVAANLCHSPPTAAEWSSKTASSVKEEEEGDDDDGFEPLPVAQEQIWNSTVTDLAMSRASSKASEMKDERNITEEENLLVKVGGGLAIVGAVVGGVALAMNAANSKRRVDKQNER